MDEPRRIGNADQTAYWNGRAGERWAMLQAQIDGVFTPFTAAVLRAAAPRAGERVLDVGCGCCATVLALAAAVGPAGRVTGVDVSAPMLEVGRRRVVVAGLAGTGLAPVDLVEADAARHAMPGRVDLLFSRFGVMFFDDPVAAFGHLHRALAPGGRLAFVCWQPMSVNPWFAVPYDAVATLVGPQPVADPLAPGPFAFADPARVHDVLGRAGFADVDVTPHEAAMPLAPAGGVATAAAFLGQIGAAARLLGEAEPAVAEAGRAAIASAVQPFEGPQGVAMKGAVWLVTASA